MSRQGRVAIIGAGITGLTCAQALVRGGMKVRLYDKGRGIGGRLATRRTDLGLRFDHGAQYLYPKDPDFAALVQDLSAAGQVAAWVDGPQGSHVGLPGMAQIARALGQGLDVAQGAMVTDLAQDGGEWQLRVDDRTEYADVVVLAIPAPQARDLLARRHAFAADLASVSYQANVTVMAGLDPAAPRPFATHRSYGALAWVSQESSKPGREGQPLTTWVVQADPDWSMAHIDLPFAELADLVAPQLLALIGADPAQLHHKAAHRWLYAQVDQPLGQPFLADDAVGLIVGGDWALGPSAEDGWASGRAMAAHLLAR